VPIVAVAVIAWRHCGFPGSREDNTDDRSIQAIKELSGPACDLLSRLPCPCHQQDAIDPSVSGNVLAFATQTGDVVVRPASGPDVPFPDASQPALSGEYLAYVDDQGIRVVRWQDGTEVARVAGPDVSRPGLNWPNLAFVQRGADSRRLIVRDLVSGETKRPASVPLSVDLGRPSLRHGRLAWHTVSRRVSRIVVFTLSTGARRAIARTKIGRLSNPSLHRGRVIWVDARSGVTYLRQASLTSNKRRNLAKIKGRSASYWTTSLAGSGAYMTRWTIPSGAAAIYRTSQ